MDVQCDADINKAKTQVRFNPDIQNVHLIRDWPFSLLGGDYGFFLKKKKYSNSQCCWKKYLDFGGGKKKSDSEFLSYNLMLNSGGKKLRFARDKNINILTLVLSENKFLNETKNHTPLLQVKWSVPYVIVYESLFQTYRAT
jgi:hypothetical protein